MNPAIDKLSFSLWAIATSPYVLLSLLLILPISPTTVSLWIAVLTLSVTYKKQNDLYTSNGRQLIVSIIMLLIIGIVFSTNPVTSVKISIKMLAGLFAIYGFYRYIRNYPLQDDKPFRDCVLLLCTIIGSIIAVMWLQQNCQPETLTCNESFFEQQNKWSTTALVLICATTALWSLHWSAIYFVLSICLLSFIWLVEGRGAMVAAIMIMSIAAALSLQRRQQLRLLIFVAALLMLIFTTTYHYWPAYLSFDFLNTLITGRPELWQSAVAIIQSHPLFGIGLGAWQNNSEINQMLTSEFHNMVSPHNILLDLVSSVGVTGSMFFTVTLYIFIKNIRQTQANLSNAHRRFGFLLFMAITINGLVDFRLFAPLFISLTGIGLVLWKTGSKP